ncbi:hypothetical protein BGZ94_005026 [Podila epigama]|nr:hypothetical protein BGZ94_005026 [Podila epigama]
MIHNRHSQPPQFGDMLFERVDTIRPPVVSVTAPLPPPPRQSRSYVRPKRPSQALHPNNQGTGIVPAYRDVDEHNTINTSLYSDTCDSRNLPTAESTIDYLSVHNASSIPPGSVKSSSARSVLIPISTPFSTLSSFSSTTATPSSALSSASRMRTNELDAFLLELSHPTTSQIRPERSIQSHLLNLRSTHRLDNVQ